LEHHRAARITAMDAPKPIIPVDLLLIIGINVVVVVLVYYLLVLWGLMQG
jgi:hypothetical protein